MKTEAEIRALISRLQEEADSINIDDENLHYSFLHKFIRTCAKIDALEWTLE